MRDITWAHCVRPGDEVHGSVEQALGTEIHVKGAHSAPVPPASVGEMSNASTRNMCWVEECGVYVWRQDMVGVENSE